MTCVYNYVNLLQQLYKFTLILFILYLIFCFFMYLNDKEKE